VTKRNADLAIQAFLRYGKGRDTARLDLADCFSHVLARNRDAQLLFKG
jgi:ribonuclease VapC